MANQQKQKTKKALAEFEPSDGSESYITQIPDMPDEWKGVADKWQEARYLAQGAIVLFVEIGELLLPLRAALTDTEFGVQRKLYANQLSRQDARRAMRMAENKERFIWNQPDTMSLPSLSIYAELFTASDALVEEIQKDTADPEVKTPTVKEVRAKAEAEKPETAEEFEESIVPPAEELTGDDPPSEEDLDAEEREQLLSIMDMPTKERIKILSEEELDTLTALTLCGFNPYFDGGTPCNLLTFHMAINAQMYEMDVDTQTEILDVDEMRILRACSDDLIKTLWGEE